MVILALGGIILFVLAWLRHRAQRTAMAALIGGVLLLVVAGVLLFEQLAPKPRHDPYEARLASPTVAVATEPSEMALRRNESVLSHVRQPYRAFRRQHL